MKARKLLEILSRGLVFRKTMPRKYGKRSIYVSPECGLRYWKPSLDKFDPMLTNVVDQFIQEGDVIWDIGANLGFFGLAASSKSKTGKCLFVEPDVWLNILLNKTKKANSDIVIDILPVAVSNKRGISKFIIANRSRATNHLSEVKGSTQTGGEREVKLVPTYTLDDLLDVYDVPNFVKIDTEGAEYLVLEGASKLLKHKPKILIEVYTDTFEKVVLLLKQNNYTLYNAERLPNLEPLTPEINTQNIIAI